MKHATLLGITALAALCGATPAFAQANRTFVSGHGSDANPCSLAAPCRSFAGALAQTNAGGEIAVLDTAGYGVVTINKAVSIVNEAGVEAGVTVSAGDAITVAAGPSDVVNLNGLTVVGLGSGGNGISFSSGASLIIGNCVIRGFTASGIAMPTTAAANLTVTDTTVSSDFSGVAVKPSGTGFTSTVMLARLHATGNSNAGVAVAPTGTNTVYATVTDSLLDNNGIAVNLITTTATANVSVDNSKLTEPGGTAVNASGSGSTANLNRSFFGIGTSTSFDSGGHILSFNNNQGFNIFTGAPTTF